MSGRLIIDVTQLVRWKGKPTGIPRVMSELSKRLDYHENTIFVVWDTLEQLFTVIDLSAMLNAKDEQQSAGPTVKEEVRGYVMQKKIINAVKKVRSESVAVRKLSQIPVKIAKKAVSMKKLKNVPIEWSQKTDEYIPEQNDTMVVFWGEWADPTYRQALITLNAQNVKLVQFAYDMLPIVTPQFSGHSTQSLTDYIFQIYPLCSKLIAISEHTKKDVAQWLKKIKKHVPPIEVVRLGDDFNFVSSKKPKDVNRVSSKFIICVGTIEARKNHTLLYYVYKRALEKNIDLPDLAIVGRRGWQTDDIYNLIQNDPGINKKIHFFENRGDDELSWLYENCLFSVYPSFYEGWGLPIAESISRGVPCASSNTSSMQEVAGSLVRYFSPNSVDECLDAIVSLLKPAELKKARSQTKKYKITTWDKTYQQVCKILEIRGN
jgi:glycosyltransferase involved in cell wall biosynthesis